MNNIFKKFHIYAMVLKYNKKHTILTINCTRFIPYFKFPMLKEKKKKKIKTEKRKSDIKTF